MAKSIITIVVTVVVCALIGFGLYFYMGRPTPDTGQPTTPNFATTTPAVTEVATSTEDTTRTVIGRSADGRDIVAYHYGEGDTELLFVGGIHGGYEWNTVSLAYTFMDQLADDPTIIPANVRVTVIPVLNPDGLEKVVGSSTARFDERNVSTDEATLVAGRFNGHGIDLNRNFDCDWNENATWQRQSVDPGTGAFSESEAAAFRDYVNAHKPTAVVVWYSAAGGVFASSCHNGVSAETKTLTDVYAKASGYKAYQDFDFYEITGDMVNWLAKEQIPAISVLLTDHRNIEWDKNRLGIEAVLKHYARE